MALVLAGFLFIALLDLVPLIKKRMTRGTAMFLVLFVAGLALALLQTGGVDVPSVMLFLEKLVRGIGLGYRS